MSFNFPAWLWREMSHDTRAAAKIVTDPGLRLRMALRAARYLVWARLAEREADQDAAADQRPRRASRS